VLGLPVRHQALRLGTVSAVLVSATDDAVLGMIVTSAWGGPDRFLPLAAAFVTPDGVESSPLALLSADDAGFYEREGARRVPHARTRGRLNAA
jgi:hypothetical protein